MLGKLTETTAGKAGVVAVAALVVCLAVFVGIKFSSNDDNRQPDMKEVHADAQKQIDLVKNNPNIPANLKAEIIRNQQGLLQGSQGASAPPPAGH